MGRPPRRRRRISRLHERHWAAITEAVPIGSMPVRRPSRWVSMVDERAEVELLRVDRHRNIVAIARAIVECSRSIPVGDRQVQTSVPTWDHLAARAGLARATVARHLATLQQWRLLARVAGGRLGVYAPGGTLSTSRPDAQHRSDLDLAAEPDNDAAVYLLCGPPPVTGAPGADAVDASETPPLEGIRVYPCTHARGDLSVRTEPLRGVESQAAARPPGRAAWREFSAWPSGITPSGKDDMLRAAAELQRRLPVLRRISTEHVRSICREFFLAGWTINDVARSIDWQPNGAARPHSADAGVDNVGAWVAYRLSAWRTDGAITGTVTRSPSQRSIAEATQARARARARRQALARHQHATAGRDRSPAAKAALAQARAASHARIRSGALRAPNANWLGSDGRGERA